MLDAYIIESIQEEQRRREVEREQARPRIHAPTPDLIEIDEDRVDEEEEEEDGPVVIPLRSGRTEEDAA